MTAKKEFSGRKGASLHAFTTFYKAHNALSAHLAKEVAFPPILQGSGFPILEALYIKGSLTQCELSKKILRTTGNISQALDKLEAAGLVKRMPGPDRRTHTILLTPEGSAMIAKWFPQMAGAIEKAFRVLDDAELHLLSNLMKKLGKSQ